MNKAKCIDLSICNYFNNNDLERDNIEPIRIVRQHVNPAIYVDSCIYDMAPFKRSPVLHNFYSDDESTHRVIKIKRCVCLTNSENCPCHSFPSSNGNDSKTSLVSNKRTIVSASLSETSLRSFDTFSTIKAQPDDLKLSIPSIITTCTSTHLDKTEKTEAFKNWCIKKSQERKRAQEERLKQEEIQQKERERLLEIERENFRKWLAKKKKEEEKQKKLKEEALENEKVKGILKEQRKLENELKYRLWLKEKEEVFLEKKVKEQMQQLRLTNEKQKRMEDCNKAYDEWLKASKYKPKPVPLNQGLQTLKTSVSVTYINPTPWVPNIETNEQNSS